MKSKINNTCKSQPTNILNKNTGYICAKLCKYYFQFLDPTVENYLKFSEIRAVKLFNSYKNLFSKLEIICTKYQIDYSKYIKFLIENKRLNKYNISENLISKKNITDFITELYVNYHNKKIIQLFQKSVDFIVSECIKLKIDNLKTYLKYIIENRKLAVYYVAGKISKYYLAALPNFPMFVSKLDNMSKNELMSICNKYEKYNNDIKEAMIQEFSNVVSVISYTNDILRKNLKI